MASRLARLSKGHWVALGAGLLTFLLVFALLRDRREMASVAVARDSIPPGSPVTENVVRFVDVPASSPLVSGLVDVAALADGGLVATRQIDAGEPLTTGAVSEEGTAAGLRSMSVPVTREHAVGGDLRPGDRVDVIDVADGQPAAWVVTDAEVLGVGEERAGSVGDRPAGFSVTLAVDGDEALRLADALADQQLEVVRSTGAPPVEPADPSAQDVQVGAGG